MLFSKETLLSYAHSKGITEIEEDALKILSQDLEYRVKELCQEASKVMLASKRTKLSIDHVNYALASRNIEPLFGYDPQESLVFKSLPPNIFYVPDKEIDLEEYLNMPLPKIPARPTISSHWLAIEGVQPKTQDNPFQLKQAEPRKEILSNLIEEAELKQQNKHVLSKELQIYFDKILSMIGTESIEVAIECLEKEGGIQQLVPYFIQHFNELIVKNLADTEFISSVICLYYSLLKNEQLFMDPYLHQILPSLLTCVIGKSVESNELREASSEIIKYIYNKYSRTYKTMAPRILNTLKKVWLDKERSEDSQYGALFCLVNLSDNVVEKIVIENEKEYRNSIGNRKVLDLLNKTLRRF